MNIYSAPLASLAALARSLRAPCHVERLGAIFDTFAPSWNHFELSWGRVGAILSVTESMHGMFKMF